MPKSRRVATARCLGLAAAALLIAAPAAGADPATFLGSSDDGSRVFFSTTQKTVRGDTDTQNDLFERSLDSGVSLLTTKHLSTGLTGGNEAIGAAYAGATADGGRVFFETAESLLATDTDDSADVYLRSVSGTTLVSAGSGGGNGAFDASYAGSSASGSVVFFTTDESLVAGDTDTATDIYARDVDLGVTSLVSTGDGGNGDFDAAFAGASADGSKVFFTSAEQLATPEDADTTVDVFEIDLGTSATRLISETGTCPVASCPASYAGASADGSRVFFESAERLGADTDSVADVYENAGGALAQISVGAAGGNAEVPAAFAGSSADGTVVFVETAEALEAADTDAVTDVYGRAGATTDLVSVGPDGGSGAVPAAFNAASASGATVIFSSAEELVAADTDGAADVFSRSGTVTTLLSGGSASLPAAFRAASDDASHVFFRTQESLAGGDSDSSFDVYDRAGLATTLVSTGPAGGNGPIDAELAGVSADGAHAVVATAESLTGDDGDGEADVFDRSGGTTVLVSTGNADSVGPNPPLLTQTDPESPGTSLTPRIRGLAGGGISLTARNSATDAGDAGDAAEDDTWVKIYTTADCSGPVAGAGLDTMLEGAGIQVSVTPDSTTTFYATQSDTDGYTSSCSTPGLTYQQVTTAPAPPSLTGVSPESPANENQPRVSGSAPPNSLVEIYTNPSCTGTPAATGTALELSLGIAVAVPDDSTTTFYARVTLAGLPSGCSPSSVTYREDSTGPGAPDIRTVPGGRAHDTSPRITGSVGPQVVRVRIYRGDDCQGSPLVAGSPEELDAGLQVQVEPNSTTRFRAKGLDLAGNLSDCSPAVTYVEDSLAPQTRITVGPGAKTRKRKVIFRFMDVTEDPGATTYLCKLDKRRWSRCSTPKRYRRLSRRVHVFRVKAIDALGNAEQTAAKRRFKVVRKRR